MATPKQTDPQFKLRMTQSLKDHIEAAAETNNRSMNAEIVARLEESFKHDVSANFDGSFVESVIQSAIDRVFQALSDSPESALELRNKVSSSEASFERDAEQRLRFRPRTTKEK